MGVTSSILPIFNPALESALIEACAPGPGLRCPFPPGALTLTCTPITPLSSACSAALVASCMAAYGELSLRSCLTTMPPEDLAIVSAPLKSVMVMIVLLNDAKMCAIPHFLSAMIHITLRCSLVFRNRQLVVAATPHSTQ